MWVLAPWKFPPLPCNRFVLLLSSRQNQITSLSCSLTGRTKLLGPSATPSQYLLCRPFDKSDLSAPRACVPIFPSSTCRQTLSSRGRPISLHYFLAAPLLSYSAPTTSKTTTQFLDPSVSNIPAIIDTGRATFLLRRDPGQETCVFLSQSYLRHSVPPSAESVSSTLRRSERGRKRCLTQGVKFRVGHRTPL